MRNIFRTHLPLLLFLCTHGLLRMQLFSAEPPRSYTRPLLHKRTSTPSSFFTNTLFQRPPFTPTSSYTNEPLHAPASRQTNFSADQLLQKPRFAPTYFCKPALTQISFYKPVLTSQIFDKPPFTQTAFTQTALHNPCLGPVGQRPEGRRNAEGCKIRGLRNPS